MLILNFVSRTQVLLILNFVLLRATLLYCTFSTWVSNIELPHARVLVILSAKSFVLDNLDRHCSTGNHHGCSGKSSIRNSCTAVYKSSIDFGNHEGLASPLKCEISTSVICTLVTKPFKLWKRGC